MRILAKDFRIQYEYFEQEFDRAFQPLRNGLGSDLKLCGCVPLTKHNSQLVC